MKLNDGVHSRAAPTAAGRERLIFVRVMLVFIFHRAGEAAEATYTSGRPLPPRAVRTFAVGAPPSPRAPHNGNGCLRTARCASNCTGWGVLTGTWFLNGGPRWTSMSDECYTTHCLTVP